MKCRSLLAVVIAFAFHLPTPAFSGVVSVYEVIFDDPNVTGTFTFDGNGNPFSHFIITWKGFNFDLTSAANTHPDYPFILQ
jgi:hypothetical protein